MDHYAQAFADAMQRSGMRNTALAAHLTSIGYNNIAQWKTGRRPIPAEHAVKVAGLLGVPPESISEPYDRLLRAGAIQAPAPETSDAEEELPGHVGIERLEDFGRLEGPERIWLPDFVLRREIGLTPVERIRWGVQPLRSMEPEIPRNALVLVDITANSTGHVVDSGIYVYSLWGRTDIRRIVTRRDGWTLIGGGGEIERIPLALDELDALRILGAVIWWI